MDLTSHRNALASVILSCAAAVLLTIPFMANAEHYAAYNSDTGKWRVNIGYTGWLNTNTVAIYDKAASSPTKVYLGLNAYTARDFVKTLNYDQMVIIGNASSTAVRFESCHISAYGFCHKKVIDVNIANDRPTVKGISYDSSSNVATIIVSEPIKQANKDNICMLGTSMWDSSTTTVCATSVSAGGKTVTASFGDTCLEEYYVRIEVKGSALKDTKNTWNSDVYKSRSMHWFCY